MVAKVRNSEPAQDWFNSKEEVLYRMAEAQKGDEWMELAAIREELVPYMNPGTVGAAIKLIKDADLIEKNDKSSKHLYRVTPLGFKVYEGLLDGKRLSDLIEPPPAPSKARPVPEHEREPEKLPGYTLVQMVQEKRDAIVQSRKLLAFLREKGYEVLDPTGRVATDDAEVLSEFFDIPLPEMEQIGSDIEFILELFGRKKRKAGV